MKMQKWIYRLIFVFCLFVVSGLNSIITAQVERSNSYILKSDKISDLEELVDYKTTKKRLRPKKRKKKEEKEKKVEIEDIDFEGPSIGGFGILLQYLMYLVIIALVVVILVMVFSNVKLEKKLKPIEEINLEDVDDIETIDAKSGLELALEAGNYREAVRMLFIQLLQVLVTEESIQWKPEKTNRDYLREMSMHDKVNHFRTLVLAYERVWYGSEEIDKEFFDYLRNDFERFYSTDKLNIDLG